MKIEEFVEKIKNQEDKLLFKKILDQYFIYKKTNKSTASFFLNNRQLDVIINYLTYLKIPFNTYKMFDESEKSVIYFGEYDNFVTLYKIEKSNIMHKDVLGALFSIGYTDEMIGDIYIQDKIYFTNLTKYNNLLEYSLKKIKNYDISLEIENIKPDIIQNFDYLNISVISLRFDLFLSKISNLSRNQTLELMSKKHIYLNYQEIKNNSIIIKEGDLLSVQTIGKFIVDKIIYNDKNKKYRIEYRKYK